MMSLNYRDPSRRTRASVGVSANVEWRRWGEIDPLYGVCSWPGRRRTDSNPWTEEEFFALGASDWQDYLRQWEQYGVIPESCVEIGCGAGRMTRAMAGFFRQIHAVDVSPDMIAYARRAVEQSSVTFHLADGKSLPLPDRSVSAAFSTLVFRHFDRKSDAHIYFKEIHRVLVGGASFMVELPIYCWPTMHRVFSLIYGTRKMLGQLRAMFRRHWLRHGAGQPFMRALIYDINWLQTTLTSIGFTDIEIRVFPLRSYPTSWHTVVLARKPIGPTT
jgi:SAM-dependent methyltransferase